MLFMPTTNAPTRAAAKNPNLYWRGTTAERLRKGAVVGAADACWRWTGSTTAFGYGRIHHEGKQLMAHRVAWLLERGPIPSGLVVCHHCDNPPCVNPAHLFLGTKADNSADMVAKGRSTAGETNPSAKLSAADVRQIRALCAGGLAQREAAERFGVSVPTIGKVVRLEHWKTGGLS